MRSALALVAFLAVGLVSGCGGGGEPAPDEGRPAPGESEASAPSSREPVPAGDPARSLEDVRERVWVMEPAGTAARLWAVQQCRAAGFEPDVRFELADLSAHARLIPAGQAVGVLPDLLWGGAPSPVASVDLPGRPTREVFLALRASSRGRAGIGEVQKLAMSVTHENQLPGVSAGGAPGVREVEGLDARRDGNNVQIDRELLTMANASRDFAEAQAALSAKFRLIRFAINEGR